MFGFWEAGGGGRERFNLLLPSRKKKSANYFTISHLKLPDTLQVYSTPKRQDQNFMLLKF